MFWVARSKCFDVTVFPTLLATSPKTRAIFTFSCPASYSSIPTGLHVDGGDLNLRHAIFIARKARHAAMTGKYPPFKEVSTRGTESSRQTKSINPMLM